MDQIGEALRSVVLAGPFQPSAIAKLLPTEAATQLAGLESFAGVPINLLTRALVEHGVPTTLIGGVRDAEPRYVKSHPLSVVVYKGSGGWSFVLNGRRRERVEILRSLREINPQIVHAQWTLEAGRAVGDWKGPKVLTVQDAAWEYMRLGWTPHPVSLAYGARWLANTSATLRRFRHVIAISPYTETYLRLIPRFGGEIRVIPNIIPELPAELAVVDRFPKTATITFACYGDPGPLKNVASAIKAFRLLAKSMPETRLLVFGGGWNGASPEFGDRIEFRGGLPHVEFLRCLATEVDIWVHPAKIETQGIAFCEALQAGCPVLGGRKSGAVPWTLDYGRAGLLVDIENIEEIAEGMRSLVLDRRHSEQMVAHGRQFIKDNFSSDRILKLHLQYYRDIISQQ